MDAFNSALDLAAAIKAKEVSPVEVVDLYLERIDRLDPQINAFTWRNDDEVRAAASTAAQAVAAGGDLPPFLGVPLPIKDLTAVAGQPCTYGSASCSDEPAAESELVIEAFQRAGFLLMGRTNTPEFGPLTVAENSRYGITRNPWDVSRSPGGSSGGAGAAVASGMAPVAHGNDGGGSIRIPASCCGLVGLKPSRGRVPVLVQPWEGSAVEGALTRTVADTAAILDVISGPDPLMWYNAPAPVRPFFEEVGADPGVLRVAVLTQPPLGLPLDPVCGAAVEAAVALLESLGHKIEPFEGDLLAPDVVGHFVNCVNAGLSSHEGEADWSKVEPHIAAQRRQAQGVDSLGYVQSAQFLQRRSRDVVAAWGRDFDVLVTPTMTIPPPEAGTVSAAAHENPDAPALPVLQMVAFTAAINILGLPAVSLPLHWSAAGLPVGVQFVGGPWGEAALLRLATQVEQAMPWSDRRPPVS